MLRHTGLAVTLTLICISQLAAQQVLPAHITTELLLSDASNYGEYDNGLPAEEVISRHSHYDAVNNAYILAFHPEEEHALRGSLQKDATSAFRELTFNSDAVVLGTPILRRSALTASHRFVFSDYEIRVDAIYSDRKNALRNARSLVVSRAGGQAKLNGCNIRAIETDFPLFHLGSQYIFFLNRNDSGSYSVRPAGAYRVEGQNLESARLNANHKAELPKHYQVEQIIRNAAGLNPRGAQ